MRKLAKLVIFMAAMPCSLAITHASDAMHTFTATYTVQNKFVTGGKALLTLQSVQEQRYQLRLETKPTGVFKLSKKGKIIETSELTTLKPPFLSSFYSYVNKGDDERNFSITYDRDKGEAIVENRGNVERININTDVQDRLSMTLSVMSQLQSNPQTEAFKLPLFDNKKAADVEFTIKGQQILDTDIGKQNTTLVERRRVNSNRHTITWFSKLGPANLPVPVQIEQYKRGKMTLRLKITKFSVIE